MAVHQRQTGNKKKKSSESSQAPAKTEQLNSDQSNSIEGSRVPWKKILTRVLLSAVMIFTVYWTSHKDEVTVFASQKDNIQLTTAEVPCSMSYKTDISKFKECTPSQCGRLVSDIVVSSAEAAHLLRICKKGLAFGGSNGGASILDLHSGSLSYQNSFINIYQKLKSQDSTKKTFTQEDFSVYSNVRSKIQQVISYNFGVPVNRLSLTHPTFFSEMKARPAQTVHDEYWHVHVDKETYPSFHYTALLYLSDYGTDFTGGRFVFVNKGKNVTVEPRIGRVSAFTSGAENPHFVEKVSSGARYALTVSFTCDPKYAIADPSVKNLQ